MKLCYETSTAMSGGTSSLLDGHKIGNGCNLTTRSKTDARKRRCAPLLAPFNANVRHQSMVFDIALFIVFIVMAVRIARIVRAESPIFLEFKQSRSIAALVFLFPIGPLVLILGTFRLGWLVAIVLATACYLPGLVVARRRVAAFERAGTDRVYPAKSAASQAFGTALAGLVYVAVILVFFLVRGS